MRDGEYTHVGIKINTYYVVINSPSLSTSIKMIKVVNFYSAEILFHTDMQVVKGLLLSALPNILLRNFASCSLGIMTFVCLPLVFFFLLWFRCEGMLASEHDILSILHSYPPRIHMSF